MDEDKELNYLLTKKMVELRKKIVSSEKTDRKEKTSREILISKLINRGEEVLEFAERYYPQKTTLIVDKLAYLIKNGEISDPISGGELLGLFRSIGLNIRIKTSIRVEKDGKLVPFTEKLKSKE